MTLNWGPSGVVDTEPFHLEEQTKAHIAQQLESAGKKSGLNSFLQEIGHAITMYLAARELHESSRPAAIRKNLKSCLTAIDNLDQAMKALDGNSLRIFLQRADRKTLNAFSEGLPILRRDFGNSLAHAQNYPRSGRLIDHARLLLAIDVGRGFQIHLEDRPTATKGGKYESILAIVLESATGVEPKKVHELACRAIVHLNSHPTTEQQT